MKTLVGTTGAFAIALFLAAAPSANASTDGIPLQPAAPQAAPQTADPIETGTAFSLSGIGTGAGNSQLNLGSSCIPISGPASGCH
ncbi:hypothetical protein ACIP5Y_12315 [Nocardia sp. NPDC088792]|uniref:hypothetical protein n=1 Tax=Nocardia sp. NPDC088792 TaxID=3364332 RepID=UPI003819893F